MVLTRDEAKTLLNITSIDFDADVDRFIPIAQHQLISITGNLFQTNMGMRITSIAQDTVAVDSSSNVYGMFFVAGDDVVIRNSVRNNEHFTVSAVSSLLLTLPGVVEEPYIKSGEHRYAEEIYGPSVWLVRWPQHIKYIVSQMIMHHIETGAKEGVAATVEPELKSKTIGDLSVTYNTKASGGTFNYPAHIYEDLRRYRVARFAS